MLRRRVYNFVLSSSWTTNGDLGNPEFLGREGDNIKKGDKRSKAIIDDVSIRIRSTTTAPCDDWLAGAWDQWVNREYGVWTNRS